MDFGVETTRFENFLENIILEIYGAQINENKFRNEIIQDVS